MLNLKPGGVAIDCTAGGGGHTQLLLEKLGSEGVVIAFDRDQQAIDHLEQKFQKQLAARQLILVHKPFSNLESFIRSQKNELVIQAIIADIGVSSPQIDTPERGFSFTKDGPLDMRMDQKQTTTAESLVNTLNMEELKTILKSFGEEPKAHYIAQAIIREREQSPITTTSRLADIVKAAVHYKSPSKTHAATKTFQALRIAVNKELDELNNLLMQAFSTLATGGRLGILSFHSLEDRIVKRQFNKWAARNQKIDFHSIPAHAKHSTPPPEGKIIKPFPLKPSDDHQIDNPRSRSVRCRVIEKL